MRPGPHWVVALALAAAHFGACRDGGSAPSANSGPATAAVRFAADADAARTGRFQTSFPLFEQRDIIAVASLPSASGPRVLRMAIIGPSGAPYQTIWRAFATRPEAGATVPHPNTGAPMSVQPAASADGLSTVAIAIPVAGTNLTRHGLSGTYTVRVSLDGGPAVATGTFELRGQP